MFPETAFHRGLHAQNSVTTDITLIRSCFHTYRVTDSSLSLRCNLDISSWYCCWPSEYIEYLEKNIHLQKHSFSFWFNTPRRIQVYFNPQCSLQGSKRPSFPYCLSLPNCNSFGPDNRLGKKRRFYRQTSKPDSQQLKSLPSINLICTLKYLPQNKTTYIDIYKVCLLQDYASAH